MSKKAPAKKASKPKAPKAPAKPKDQKNGITRPAAGSTTGKIWDLADKAAAKNKHNNNRGEVIEAAGKLGIVEATAATQFGKWRVYNGIKGRVAKPKAPKAAKKPAPPKAPTKKKPAPPAPPAASEAPAAPAATGK